MLTPLRNERGSHYLAALPVLFIVGVATVYFHSQLVPGGHAGLLHRIESVRSAAQPIVTDPIDQKKIDFILHEMTAIANKYAPPAPPVPPKPPLPRPQQ